MGLELGKGAMNSNDEQHLHVFFLPYMAPGHMIPMVDMARLFAARGVKVSIITTTMNAPLIQSAVERDINSGRRIISLEILPFPSVQAGLPQGCENLSCAATREMTMKLFHAIEMLQQPIEQLLYQRRPDCIVSDIFFPYTADVAIQLGIPRLFFNGSGYLHPCVYDSIQRYAPHEKVSSESERFLVPGLPHHIEFSRSQLPDILKSRNEFSNVFERIKESERKSYGALMNSFYELEPAYVDHFTKDMGTKSWHVGPVSLHLGDTKGRAGGRNKHSVIQNTCMSWLDTKQPNTVLYACFGSLTRFSSVQLQEIASALEASGHPFIWVLGKIDIVTKGKDEEDEWWLPEAEGFEVGTKEVKNGLVIRGWAPQIRILQHQAVGGFLTHCGWNSILEGVSVGVPMITWPIFAEQFYNEKLVTQVLKIGVGVGNEVWRSLAIEDSGTLVKREDIERAVSEVIGSGDEAEEMRKRARHLGELAKRAVEEGGSSCVDLANLHDDIKMYANDQTKLL